MAFELCPEWACDYSERGHVEARGAAASLVLLVVGPGRVVARGVGPDELHRRERALAEDIGEPPEHER